ncbi:MAG: VTT domain-containing protein [Vicinamibacterales bacterium]|nr:VTT domain-containing protein [Vicinamibacterales bacterium]
MLVLALLVLYAARPELLDPARVVATLRASGRSVLLGYVILSIVRPFTLVPSSVLIVVLTLLYPDRPWFVMASSLGGIVLAALLIYYFFEFLGLGDLFERKHARQVRWLEGQMHRRGFWIVVGWSLFPFVPTDAICYVAGTLRMPPQKFAVGVALGEMPLVVFYVWATGTVLTA